MPAPSHCRYVAQGHSADLFMQGSRHAGMCGYDCGNGHRRKPEKCALIPKSYGTPQLPTAAQTSCNTGAVMFIEAFLWYPGS